MNDYLLKKAFACNNYLRDTVPLKQFFFFTVDTCKDVCVSVFGHLAFHSLLAQVSFTEMWKKKNGHEWKDEGRGTVHCRRSGRRVPGPGDLPFLTCSALLKLVVVVLLLSLALVVVTAVEGSLLSPHCDVVPSADSLSLLVIRERAELPRWRSGNMEFSGLSALLTSRRAAHVHAFMKLFLKLSLRNAYRMGLRAELMYDRQEDSRKSTTLKLLWPCLGGLSMSVNWRTQ